MNTNKHTPTPFMRAWGLMFATICMTVVIFVLVVGVLAGVFVICLQCIERGYYIAFALTLLFLVTTICTAVEFLNR